MGGKLQVFAMMKFCRWLHTYVGRLRFTLSQQCEHDTKSAFIQLLQFYHKFQFSFDNELPAICFYFNPNKIASYLLLAGFTIFIFTSFQIRLLHLNQLERTMVKVVDLLVSNHNHIRSMVRSTCPPYQGK